MEKKKKPFYKRVWFWILAVIIVAAISSTRNGKADVPETSTDNTIESVSPDTTEVQEEPANDPRISKAEFDKIENGMTYEEVVKIIGGEGEVMSEVGEKGTEYYTVMYTYDGESGLGSNANFMFQNGKLTSKAQFGLK